MSPARLRIDRRSFLALAGSGAALAALARVAPGAALGCGPGAPPREGAEGARFFAPDEADVLAAVVERIVDTGLPDAPPVRESGAVLAIDRLCTSLDPELTRPLPALLRLVEWGPLVFDFAFARFRALPPEAQDASLRGWMTSSLALRRQGFQALKGLACYGWYSQEESWRLVGYAGPLLRAGGSP
ncbi:MAG TPA: hypothetical protein VHQ66_03335 [Myxococcota bacterium]|nr:hypothetical protein [Myxococcota bacterium]